jgi:hypothetical protein
MNLTTGYTAIGGGFGDPLHAFGLRPAVPPLQMGAALQEVTNWAYQHSWELTFVFGQSAGHRENTLRLNPSELSNLGELHTILRKLDAESVPEPQGLAGFATNDIEAAGELLRQVRGSSASNYLKEVVQSAVVTNLASRLSMSQPEVEITLGITQRGSTRAELRGSGG